MSEARAEIPETPGVSEDELDLTAVLPAEERYYTTQIVWRELEQDGTLSARTLETTVLRFPMRKRLPIPTMTALLRLETAINEALAKDDEEADAALEKLLDKAHERIVGLIVERTPAAFAPRERERAEDGRKVMVSGALELDVDEILVTLAWIAGDTSVADAVAKALTAGRSHAKTEEELQAEAAERGEPAEARPLA